MSTKGASSRRTAAGLALDLFEQHQGTHILQVSEDKQTRMNLYGDSKDEDPSPIDLLTNPIVSLFISLHPLLQSLDGFALALAGDGRFLYISETVSIYLGLSQVCTTTAPHLINTERQRYGGDWTLVVSVLVTGQRMEFTGDGQTQPASECLSVTGGSNKSHRTM